jgi:hypothetical protein
MPTRFLPYFKEPPDGRPHGVKTCAEREDDLQYDVNYVLALSSDELVVSCVLENAW